MSLAFEYAWDSLVKASFTPYTPSMHPAAAKYFARGDRENREDDRFREMVREIDGDFSDSPGERDFLANAKMEDYADEYEGMEPMGETGGIEDRYNRQRMSDAELHGDVERQSYDPVDMMGPLPTNILPKEPSGSQSPYLKNLTPEQRDSIMESIMDMQRYPYGQVK